MKHLYLTAALLLAATPAFAGYSLAPSKDHQPIKAEVTNPDPGNFTINLKKLANLNVDQEAKTFVMYTGATLPPQCGDFSNIDINYQKPDKYHRIFNLADKPDVLAALDDYHCVIIPNKPKLPPAKS